MQKNGLDLTCSILLLFLYFCHITECSICIRLWRGSLWLRISLPTFLWNETMVRSRYIRMNDNTIVAGQKYGAEIYDLGEKPFEVKS